MSPAAVEEMPKLGRNLCTLYAQLSSAAKNAGEQLWRFSPKHHLFLHLAEWQSVLYGNPRYYWCYADEDLVGHIMEVSRSCHIRTMAGTSLFKWSLFAFPEADEPEE